MQFIVYTDRGDALSTAIVGQIRAVLGSCMLTAQVQLIDDPQLLRMNGITNTPVVMLDGSYISCGYTPSRSELENAIQRRSQALALGRSTFENMGESRLRR